MHASISCVLVSFSSCPSDVLLLLLMRRCRSESDIAVNLVWWLSMTSSTSNLEAYMRISCMAVRRRGKCRGLVWCLVVLPTLRTLYVAKCMHPRRRKLLQQPRSFHGLKGEKCFGTPPLKTLKRTFLSIHINQEINPMKNYLTQNPIQNHCVPSSSRPRLLDPRLSMASCPPAGRPAFRPSPSAWRPQSTHGRPFARPHLLATPIPPTCTGAAHNPSPVTRHWPVPADNSTENKNGGKNVGGDLQISDLFLNPPPAATAASPGSSVTNHSPSAWRGLPVDLILSVKNQSASSIHHLKKTSFIHEYNTLVEVMCWFGQ